MNGRNVDEVLREVRGERWWKRDWEGWALPWDDERGRRRRVEERVRKRWGEAEPASRKEMEGDGRRW